MKFNKVKLLIPYSILYVSFCIAIINFIGIDFDFRHRLFQNLYGLFGFISIFTWFFLLVTFLKYDGTKKSKWNKLCYKLYLFKDKTPNGRLSRDVIYPTLFWSIFIFFFAPFMSFALFYFFLCLVFLSIFIIFNPIIFAFQKSQLFFILLLIFMIMAFILACFHNQELQREQIRYDYLARLRTIYCVNFYIVGYLLLLIGIVKGYVDVASFIQLLKMDKWEFIDSAKALLYPLINIFPGALVLYICRRNLNSFMYAQDSFYLYLRSFKFDKNEDALLNLLPKEKRQIMKIGNPTSRLFPNLWSKNSMYNDIFFLPSSNWKKHLDFYIYKAFSIISVVDDTPGVVWEMFNHPEYFYKIVFYVDSNVKLRNLELMVRKSEELNMSPNLCNCIHHLIELNISTPFVFWIKDNKCFYNSNISIISSLLKSKLNVSSDQYFDIDGVLYEHIRENKNAISKFRKWNIASNFISEIRKILSLVYNIIPFGWLSLVVIIIVIINLLIPLAILYCGVDFIQQGDVLPGIIFLMIGLGIIAFLLKFVKGKI